ncbi:cytochrome b561 [Kitasatospora sp. MAA19]|uniref:hypothetical protein n=1 Tax=unclassified Kitasatospora TaxID=2633591 RepID=UPI00247564B1|nr:hypothetical protein [Kitasatospora sp. MAA19]MDH6707849.1 cytochrome b561 [Kitasatospora sp. MAA19]
MTHDGRTAEARGRDEVAARGGTHTNQDERTITFLRLGVGLIGIVLPLALPLGNWLFAEFRGQSTAGFWPASMSGSYYTSTRNLFVGGLCALGVFLICYRFDRRDDRWSTAAGVFALGVALCPTAPRDATTFQATVGVLHLVFASLLLFVLAMFCLFSFRNPSSAQPSRVGWAYLAAGVLILVLLLLAVVAGVTGIGSNWAVRPLYLCEWFSTWAFGAAWTGAARELAAAGGSYGKHPVLPGQAGALTADNPTAQPQ